VLGGLFAHRAPPDSLEAKLVRGAQFCKPNFLRLMAQKFGHNWHVSYYFNYFFLLNQFNGFT